MVKPTEQTLSDKAEVRQCQKVRESAAAKYVGAGTAVKEYGIATADVAVLKADRSQLVQELESAGAVVRGAVFKCPFHDDRKPSGSIFTTDGFWFAKCHGCEFFGDVIDVVRRAHALNFAEAVQRLSIATHGRPRKGAGKAYPSRGAAEVAILAMFPGGHLRSFTYSDHQAVVRIDFGDGRQKEIRPIHRDGETWFIGKGKQPWPLYRVAEALHHNHIYVVEGEGVADEGWSIGLPCVTWQGGCKNVHNIDFAPISSHELILLPDNDANGRQAMGHVARQAAHVRMLELPDLPRHGDIVDFIQKMRGRSPEELRTMIKQVVEQTPQWTASVMPETASLETKTGSGETWPEPMDDAAYYGLAGDVVRTIEPHTEADPVALLIQFLVVFGNVIGRSAHFIADGARHYANLFIVLVGETSKARKGTAWSQIIRIFETCEATWANERAMSGLSSGEGLIWNVRDPIMGQVYDKKAQETKRVVTDVGILDKRLLVYEPEFASVLRVCQRDGNTLSPVIRLAWERGNLRMMTKNSPAAATGAHVSIVGHVVADELRRYLDRSEIAGGFGNRFLWLCVRRSKCLPEGGELHRVDFSPFVEQLNMAIAFAREPHRLTRDESARVVWHRVYPDLSEGRPGLAGALIARGEAQVMRLASIYALLGRSRVIQAEHLQAALAVQEYVERSVYHVFGRSLGDPVADDIYAALRVRPDGMTRTEIRDLFQRHVSRDRLGRALELLAKSQLARLGAPKTTSGRPVERWFAV